jgi:hypothetical protein
MPLDRRDLVEALLEAELGATRLAFKCLVRVANDADDRQADIATSEHFPQVIAPGRE